MRLIEFLSAVKSRQTKDPQQVCDMIMLSIKHIVRNTESIEMADLITSLCGLVSNWLAFKEDKDEFANCTQWQFNDSIFLVAFVDLLQSNQELILELLKVPLPIIQEENPSTSEST